MNTKSITLTKHTLIVTFLIYLFGCNSSQPFLVPLTDYSSLRIIHKQHTVYSSDSTVSIPLTLLNVTYPIDFISIDSIRHRAFLKFTPQSTNSKIKETVIAYDLSDKKNLWAWHADGFKGQADIDYYILYKSDKTVGFSPDSGKVLWDLPGYNTIYPVLNLAVQRTWEESPYVESIEGFEFKREKVQVLIARELYSGKILWRKKPSTTDIEWAVKKGNKLFTVSNGLECIDIKTGEGWFVSRSTTATEGEFKAAVKNILSGAVAIMNGGGVVGGNSPDQLYNLSSPPLLISNRVFFAAKDLILCCDVSSGDVLWESQVECNPSVVSLHSLNGNILATYEGYRYQNEQIVTAGYPAIFLLNANDGTIITSLKLNSQNPVLDLVTLPNSVFAITPQKLMLFDENLILQKEVSSNEYGDFFKIIAVANNRVYTRNLNGVLALSSESLDDIWWAELPVIKINPNKNPWKMTHAMKGNYVFLNNNRVYINGSWKDLITLKLAQEHYNHFYLIDGGLWVKSIESFICLNSVDGEKIISFDLPSEPNHVSIGSQGTLHSFGQNAYISVPLNLK